MTLAPQIRRPNKSQSCNFLKQFSFLAFFRNTYFLSRKQVICLFCYFERFKDIKTSQSSAKPNASEGERPAWGVAGEVTDANEGHNQQCCHPKVV